MPASKNESINFPRVNEDEIWMMGVSFVSKNLNQ